LKEKHTMSETTMVVLSHEQMTELIEAYRQSAPAQAECRAAMYGILSSDTAAENCPPVDQRSVARKRSDAAVAEAIRLGPYSGGLITGVERG
jgi:hypothetical protein